MSAESVRSLNDFARAKHPGLCGVEVVTCEPEEVTGRLVVREELVAGTGYLWAPVVITLADWLASVGTGENLPGDVSFTTVELKCNFLGTARLGETVLGRAVPAHRGRTTHVWDVEITHAATGRALALFRCTQMILYPKR